MTKDMHASALIAEFATAFTSDHVTAGHLEQVARAVVDTVAVALAGHREPAASILLARVRNRRDRDMAHIWGSDIRLPLEEAALYNGVAGHVLDFDDVTSPLRGHPSIALLPALLALGEAIDASGRELAAAYVVGFEVMVKLARAMVSDHYARGWHATTTLGTIGGAVACAHLLKLSRKQVVDAIGLAVAQAAGARINFGTMAKSYQAGHCGASALRAALLARDGFDSSPVALDDRQGFMTLYGKGEDLTGLLESMGRDGLEIDVSGLEIKKYPMCYAAHRTIDGVLDLRAEHQLSLNDIARVDVRSNFRAMVPLIHTRPQTGLEGKFSMQYAVAAALLDGHVGLASFEDTAVQRPAIQAFLPQVDAREEEGPVMPRWNHVRITTRTGDVLEKTITQLRGAADCPLSQQELLTKANDCVAFGRYPGSAEAFVQTALALGTKRVRDIIETCPKQAL